MPRNDCVRFSGAPPQGRLLEIEPEAGFTRCRIWPMTTETIPGKNRLYILIEIQWVAGARSECWPVSLTARRDHEHSDSRQGAQAA